MTVAVPTFALRQLARPIVARKPLDRPTFTTEPQGDRTFVTLLSLNFMLLAFFIVLGAVASVDKSRARAIAANVRVTFSGNEVPAKPRSTLLTARQALQAGVSDAFADVLPMQLRSYVDNSDRIDVHVPESVLISNADRDTVYDNIAQLLQAAPTGFRYALLIAGGRAATTSGKAAYDFAGSLVTRGVVPQDILVGSSTANTDALHLSFLVFEGEFDEDSEPWTAGMFAAAPMSARFSAPVPEQPAIEQESPQQESPEPVSSDQSTGAEP